MEEEAFNLEVQSHEWDDETKMRILEAKLARREEELRLEFCKNCETGLG